MIAENRLGDGYARLTPSAIEVLVRPSEGGVVFVDMNLRSEGWDLVIAALRAFPPSVVTDSAQIVFRSPVVRWPTIDPKWKLNGNPAGWPGTNEAMAEAIDAAMDNHRLPQRRVSVVEMPIGGAPDVAGPADRSTLARCRAIELQTYLHQNEAIWQPASYHYQFPSGDHAATFVRIADCFRDPRAPLALGTWLHGSLEPSTAVVVDSGTLMPLVQQLDYLLRVAAAGLPLRSGGLAAVETLDHYPFSRFEFLRRFGSFGDLNVLALLSVSSSGRTYDTLKEALNDTAGDGWRAECLVSRTAQAATALPEADLRGRQQPWLGLSDLGPLYDPGDRCPLCRDVNQARVIQINPRSFAAMALPIPTRIMPDTDDARRNAALFESYQGVSSRIAPVQVASSERSRLRAAPFLRPDEPRRVRFEPTALLQSVGKTRSLIRSRIATLQRLPERDPARRDIERALLEFQAGRPTVAVCDAEELRILGKAARGLPNARARLLAAAKAACPTVGELVAGNDRSVDLRDELHGHSSVLLLVAGLQTGVTLQHLVVQVQSALSAMDGSDDAEMYGLVVHAHPTDSDAWHSVRNSFRGRSGRTRLLALWLTYLSPTSPLAEEFDLLDTAQAGWFGRARPGVRRIWDERRRWLKPEGGGRDSDVAAPPSPVWSPERQTLRKTSIYGELDDRHTLVAAGAAMQEALQRESSQGAPEWVEFDLPNVFRSYFDALIHVAVLRWLTPERAWWGAPNDCRSLLAELQGRFVDDDGWQLLLPELLLAAAQGKVPDVAHRDLLNDASQRLEAGVWPAEVLDYVQLGQILAERFRPLRPLKDGRRRPR